MNTGFPGIKNFCLSSGIVIFACYCLVLTLFDSILVLEWRRSLVLIYNYYQDSRNDWCCCIQQIRTPSDIEKDFQNSKQRSIVTIILEKYY